MQQSLYNYSNKAIVVLNGGVWMKMYSVDEAFDLLSVYKITTNKESIRRWLRQGVIKAPAPSSRKEGWQIPKEALDDFLQQRLPDVYPSNVLPNEEQINKTIVAKEMDLDYTTNDVKRVEEQARANMWRELARKNIWEGYVELKKTRIRECIEHRHYSKQLELEVWQRYVANSRAYRKPRVSYLLEAFSFEGKRLLLDQNFADLEEQVIFAIIEHVRKSR